MNQLKASPALTESLLLLVGAQSHVSMWSVLIIVVCFLIASLPTSSYGALCLASPAPCPEHADPSFPPRSTLTALRALTRSRDWCHQCGRWPRESLGLGKSSSPLFVIPFLSHPCHSKQKDPSEAGFLWFCGSVLEAEGRHGGLGECERQARL